MHAIRHDNTQDNIQNSESHSFQSYLSGKASPCMHEQNAEVLDESSPNLSDVIGGVNARIRVAIPHSLWNVSAENEVRYAINFCCFATKWVTVAISLQWSRKEGQIGHAHP